MGSSPSNMGATLLYSLLSLMKSINFLCALWKSFFVAMIPLREAVSDMTNLVEGIADLDEEQKHKWYAKIVEAAIKAYQARIAAYNTQATKLYEIIKAAMSEAVRLECHNRFTEQWKPHMTPSSATMEQPQVLWQLVYRTMTSSENGNHFAMALAAMKRLSAMQQSSTESLLDWNTRVEDCCIALSLFIAARAIAK
jgi:hypothetical protein